MKISVTQSGITFSTMDPVLAEALIDIVRDIASGDAVLVYGPEYIPLAIPSDDLRDKMESLLHADAKYPGALMPDYRDGKWWRSEPLLEETHRQVWGEIEDVRSNPIVTTEAGTEEKR